jgi:hypothetical protein
VPRHWTAQEVSDIGVQVADDSHDSHVLSREDKEERLRTMWAVYCFDKYVSRCLTFHMLIYIEW